MVDAILDAVPRVLARTGAAGLTTNRIAKAAGVSIGSLYQYFRDKRAILAAVRDRHVGQMGETIQLQLSRLAGASLEETLRGLLAAMVEAHARDRHLYELLLFEVPQDAGSDDPALDRRVDDALQRSLAAHAPELDPGLDPRRLVFVLRPLLESLAHAVALRRPRDLSAAAALDEAARVLWGYLGSYRVSGGGAGWGRSRG